MEKIIIGNQYKTNPVLVKIPNLGELVFFDEQIINNLKSKVVKIIIEDNNLAIISTIKSVNSKIEYLLKKSDEEANEIDEEISKLENSENHNIEEEIADYMEVKLGFKKIFRLGNVSFNELETKKGKEKLFSLLKI